MSYILGITLTAAGVLLCSLIIAILTKYWLAGRAQRSSKPVSAATNAEQAPPKWESRLRDLEAEVASLSSSFEKVSRLLMRLNSRAGMRELREQSQESHGPPPLGAPKAEIRKHFGLNVGHAEFVKKQLSLVKPGEE